MPGAGRVSTCRTRRRARPPRGPRSTRAPRPTFRPAPNGFRMWNRPPARTLRAPSPSSRRRVLARCACRGWRAGGSCRSPALRRHPCIPRRRDRPRPDRQDREQGPAQPQGEPPPRGAWRERAAGTIGGTGHPPASDAGFAEPGRRSSERAQSPRAFGPDGPIRCRTSYSLYSRKSYRGGSRASISARGIRLLTTNTPFSTWLM